MRERERGGGEDEERLEREAPIDASHSKNTPKSLKKEFRERKSLEREST